MVNSIIGLIVIILIAFGVYSFTKSDNKSTTTESQKQSDSWNRIKSDKQITIGLDDTFVPMGFRNNKGKLVGFDVDLANAVFKELGVKVKWQQIDWSMKETELNNGNIDAIWNGYTITDARKKKVAFSNPYYNNTQLLVTLKKTISIVFLI